MQQADNLIDASQEEDSDEDEEGSNEEDEDAEEENEEFNQSESEQEEQEEEYVRRHSSMQKNQIQSIATALTADTEQELLKENKNT